MKNLLTETIEFLKSVGHAQEDVRWVGSYDGKYAVRWASFQMLANFEYHNGFGSQEVNSELVVVGDDWWLERGEYDGSEWWEYKKLPVRAERPTTISNVRVNYYDDSDWNHDEKS